MEKISRTKSVFFFDFTYCVKNFNKIGPIIKKWGGIGGSQGVQI